MRKLSILLSIEVNKKLWSKRHWNSSCEIVAVSIIYTFSDSHSTWITDYLRYKLNFIILKRHFWNFIPKITGQYIYRCQWPPVKVIFTNNPKKSIDCRRRKYFQFWSCPMKEHSDYYSILQKSLRELLPSPNFYVGHWVVWTWIFILPISITWPSRLRVHRYKIRYLNAE